MLISLNQPAKNSVRLALKDQKQTFFQLKKLGFNPEFSALASPDTFQ